MTKKDRLNTGRYHLLWLQEIVVSVATANMMLLHVVPMQNQNKKHSHVIAIYLV
jgi:hypothetical protein